MSEKHKLQVLFRDTIYHVNDIDSEENFINHVEKFIWDWDVFETDTDPLWVILNGKMIAVMRLAFTHRGYTKGWPGDLDENIRVEESRVVNMFAMEEKYVDTITMHNKRPVEEGELDL